MKNMLLTFFLLTHSFTAIQNIKKTMAENDQESKIFNYADLFIFNFEEQSFSGTISISLHLKLIILFAHQTLLYLGKSMKL